MSFIFIETNEIVSYILVSILSRCQWRGVYYNYSITKNHQNKYFDHADQYFDHHDL